VHTAAFFIALAVMLAGVAGVVMPALPGIPLIWLAMLGYGVVEGFREMSPGFLFVTLLVVVVSMVAEHYTKAWGARRYGAGRAGTWGVIIGSIVGLFFMPIGLLAGPFLGALIGELMAGRSAEDAVRAGWGGLVGVLGSVVVNVMLALMLVLSFILRVIIV
jgi:uncharacterized protein YqgC (DUF456 family)